MSGSPTASARKLLEDLLRQEPAPAGGPQHRDEALLTMQRDLGLALSATSDLPQALGLVAAAAQRISGFEVSLVYLAREDDALELVEARGLPDEVRSLLSLLEADSYQTRLARLGAPVYTHYELFKRCLRESHGPLHEARWAALGMIPLRHGSTVLGALVVLSRTEPAVPMVVRMALETVAAHLGSVISRLRTEASLAVGEQLLRTTLDALHDAVYVVDPQLRLVSWNEAMVRTLASLPLPAPQRGMPLPQRWAELTDETSLALLQRAFASGQANEHTREVATAQGRRWFEIRNVPIASEQGGVQLVVVVGRDVTERHLADEALRRERDLVRNILESSPDPITIFGLDGSVQECNPASLRQQGASAPAQLLGRRLDELVVATDLQRVTQDLARLHQGEMLSNLPYRMRRLDGREYEVELSMALLRDRRGQPQGYVAIGQDVTARKQLAEELRQAQKMESIGRLAGGVAHDFSNLLCGILGTVRFAIDSLPPEHVARPELEEVLAAGRRAEGLTRRLLTFSRRQRLETKVLAVDKLILQMDKLLQRLIGEDVELVTRTAQGPWWVRADPGALQQVVINLAINAREAMRSGGGSLTLELTRIHVDEAFAQLHPATRTGEFVRLTVRDTGPGFPAELAAHAFEPFFTTKEAEEGAGLGLASVYGLVKQHEGFIRLDNRPGLGAAFEIYLPSADPPPPQAEGTPEGTPAGGKEQVLVVEDEPLVRRLIVRTLRRLGYRVLTATNGVEALEVAEQHGAAIDLLLSDVVMPRMGGRELAAELRRRRPELPVLLVSGYSRDEFTLEGQPETDWTRQGRFRFLDKPFTAEQLARTLRELLDAPA